MQLRHYRCQICVFCGSNTKRYQYFGLFTNGKPSLWAQSFSQTWRIKRANSFCGGFFFFFFVGISALAVLH